MRQVRSVLIVTLGIVLSSYAGGSLSAQTTSATEVKQFEVVSVDGNKVVVKGENGAAQEITVPPDFRLTVDGRPVSVQELKPGMRGSARITTTTTVTPVTITEVKKGKVLKASGNTIIVRTEEGNKMFSESDAAKRGVKINDAEGKPIPFRNLREGYELTATIVTQQPPRVLTQREVDAELSSPPATAPAAARTTRTQSPPAPARVASAPRPSAPTPANAPSGAPMQLPKTGSELPLLSLLGTSAFALAAILRARRRA